MERGRGYLRRGKRIGDERFDSVRGECESVKLHTGAPSMFRLTRIAAALDNMLSALNLMVRSTDVSHQLWRGGGDMKSGTIVPVKEVK